MVISTTAVIIHTISMDALAESKSVSLRNSTMKIIPLGDLPAASDAVAHHVWLASICDGNSDPADHVDESAFQSVR